MATMLQEIADAWNSVGDRWLVRWEKRHAARRWEVVREGRTAGAMSETVVGRFATQREAEDFAAHAEDMARAAAVAQALDVEAEAEVIPGTL